MLARLTRWLLLVAILWVAGIPGEAQAQVPGQDGLVVVAEPLGELVRPGRWAPLRVKILNQGDDARAVVRVEERAGTRSAAYERTVDLPEGGRRDVILLYRPGTSQAKRTVTVTSPTRRAAAPFQLRQASAEAATVGILGTDALGLQLVTETTGGATPGRSTRTTVEGPRSVVSGLIEPGVLPRHSAGWEAFDQLVWPAADPTDLEPDQQQALLHWVADGGHLTLFVAETVAGFSGSLFADVLPHPITRTEDHTDLAPLSERWPVGIDRLPLGVGDGPPAGTVLLATDDGTPVWSIRRHGLGTIALLGFDPRQLGLASTPARTAFWRDVLHLPAPETPLDATGLPRTLLHATPVGPTVVDTGMQADARVRPLRAELSDIPGVAPLPLEWLLVFSGIYLVIIGPIEWIVLSRLRRRPMTWITFPVTIVVFSTVALVGTARIKGDQAVVTAVEVVDLLPGTGLWRGRTHLGVFATANRRITLTAPVSDGVARPATDPGYADAIVVSAGLGPGEAAWTEETWTLGYATTRWVAPAPPTVDVRPQDDGWTVHNRLDQPLTDVTLVRGDRTWTVPTLAPGEVRPLTEGPPLFTRHDVLDGMADGEGVLLAADFDGLLTAVTGPLQPPVVGGLRPSFQRRTVLRVPLLDDAPENR